MGLLRPAQRGRDCAGLCKLCLAALSFLCASIKLIAKRAAPNLACPARLCGLLAACRWEMSADEKAAAAAAKKERGNAAYKAGKLSRAVKQYTEAVDIAKQCVIGRRRPTHKPARPLLPVGACASKRALRSATRLWP